MTDAAKDRSARACGRSGPPVTTGCARFGAGIDDQPLQKIRGTTAEKLLLNDDVLPAIIPGYRPGDPVPADVFDQAMKKPWLSSQTREERRARFQKLAGAGRLRLHGRLRRRRHPRDGAGARQDGALAGRDVQGAARAHLPRPRRPRARPHHGPAPQLRGVDATRSTTTTSSGPIRDESPENAWETEHKLSEHAYASVMDYGARFNSDIHGLGKYDTAAIRFGYGQIIDLIPRRGRSARTPVCATTSSSTTTPCCPPTTGGIDKFDTAATTVVPYQQFIDSGRRSSDDIASSGGRPSRAPERPYKFCEDLFEGNLDCKTWDSRRQPAGDRLQRHRAVPELLRLQRLPARALTWSIDGYLNRLQERYFNRYSEAFQFFFFLSDYMQLRPRRRPVPGVGRLRSTRSRRVLQTPEPGLHCPTAVSPTVATYPVETSGTSIRACACRTSRRSTIRLPDAKPFYIDFSDDYYYTFTRVGSLLREAAGAVGAHQHRVAVLPRRRAVRRRGPVVDQLLPVVPRRGRQAAVGRDPQRSLAVRRDDRRDAAAAGSQPMPVIDLETFGLVGNPTPPYAQPGSVHVPTPVNRSIRYWAMLFGLARLGSTWDSTLDFQNFLTIGVKGADDDFTVGSNAVVEFTHPETGIDLPRHHQLGRHGAQHRQTDPGRAERDRGRVRDARDHPGDHRQLHRRFAAAELVHREGRPGRRRRREPTRRSTATRTRCSTTSTASSATAWT